MKTNQIFLPVFFAVCVGFISPTSIQAAEPVDSSTTETSFFARIQERIEYFLAFGVENKVQVLEKQAEKRLEQAQNNVTSGNSEKANTQLQDYLQTKERQNNLIDDMDHPENVMNQVEERTINQQHTMEQIKNVVDEDMKQEVVQVQEQVVNQVAKRVVDINGSEGLTEFFGQVEHVWAPGTGPGGEAGVVIVGGSMKFAPGTSAGGPAGSDIKTVEIKTGGTVNDPMPVQNGPNYAPGTSGNSPGNTIDSGVKTDNSGTNNTRIWIDP